MFADMTWVLVRTFSPGRASLGSCQQNLQLHCKGFDIWSFFRDWRHSVNGSDFLSTHVGCHHSGQLVLITQYGPPTSISFISGSLTYLIFYSALSLVRINRPQILTLYEKLFVCEYFELFQIAVAVIQSVIFVPSEIIAGSSHYISIKYF